MPLPTTVSIATIPYATSLALPSVLHAFRDATIPEHADPTLHRTEHVIYTTAQAWVNY